MRSLSLRDMQLIDELSHFNEVELIHPANDKLMEYYLNMLGLDTEFSWTYIPANHRDMQNKVAVGYRVVGEWQINRAFVNSYLCSTAERVAISSYTDPSLTQELSSLMNNTLDFNSFNEDGVEDNDGPLFDDQTESDWKYVEAQINQLVEIRDWLRGPPLNAAGTAKTKEEVASWYKGQQFYEEKYL